MIQMEQVHGNRVVVVDKSDDGKTIENCDGLITKDPGITLSVHVADCLPILLSDKKGGVAGIIHAGWRGLDSKIIGKAVNIIESKFKINGSELMVYIGAHICQKHYEVKSDVSEKFSTYVKGRCLDGSRTFLDLGEVARLQLLALGVKNKNITIDPTCTFEDKHLFSYRRGDKKKRNLYELSFSSNSASNT